MQRNSHISIVNYANFSVRVIAYIWSDNGHNLFDYESDSLVKKAIDFDF